MKKIEDKNDEIKYYGVRVLKILLFLLFILAIYAIILINKQLRFTKLLLTIIQVISPLFIGFVLAWLFNPIVKKLTQKGINRIIGSIIVYIVFLILLVVFIRVFIPVLYSQINDLITSLPAVITKLNDIINEFVMSFNTKSIDLSGVKDTLINNLGTIIMDYTNKLPNLVINIIVKIFSGLGTILIGLVVGLYMLFDFDSIQKFFIKLIPKKNRYDFETLTNNIGNEVRKTVNGTLLVALVVFICDTIGFAIVGLKAPLLLGLFCGLTDLIPYIGPYIGGAAATLMGFSVSPVIGITTLIICIIVQIVESYILQPIVMSKAVSIHPVAIIIGLLVFGYFFGIIGMIIATPCLAIFKVIITFILSKKEFA